VKDAVVFMKFRRR